MPDPALTGAQKLLALTLSTPSGMPVALSMVLIVELTAASTCVGPVSPCESGGTQLPLFGEVIPVKLVATLCANCGSGPSRANEEILFGFGSETGNFGEFGFVARWLAL